MTVTLLQLKTRIKQRTNNEHTSGEFLGDAELTQLVNTSGQRLHGLLTKCGIHQTEEVQTIYASGQEQYALNDDHLALLAVFRLDSNKRVRLTRHDHRLRPDTTQTGDATTYRLMNESIQFNPTPATGTYELVYIPKFTELDDDTDELEGVNGWEEFIVLDASIRVLQKEMLDARDLKEERAEMYRQIQDEAAARDLSESWAIHYEPRSEHARIMDDMNAELDVWSRFSW